MDPTPSVPFDSLSLRDASQLLRLLIPSRVSFPERRESRFVVQAQDYASRTNHAVARVPSVSRFPSSTVVECVPGLESFSAKEPELAAKIDEIHRQCPDIEMRLCPGC